MTEDFREVELRTSGSLLLERPILVIGFMPVLEYRTAEFVVSGSKVPIAAKLSLSAEVAARDTKLEALSEAILDGVVPDDIVVDIEAKSSEEVSAASKSFGNAVGRTAVGSELLAFINESEVEVAEMSTVELVSSRLADCAVIRILEAAMATLLGTSVHDPSDARL